MVTSCIIGLVGGTNWSRDACKTQLSARKGRTECMNHRHKARVVGLDRRRDDAVDDDFHRPFAKHLLSFGIACSMMHDGPA